MSKALVIIDIQNDYFEYGAMELVGSSEAAENAKQILARFRNQNLPVVHIQHLSVDPNATFFLPETKGQELHQSVEPLAGEKVITKYYPNSFKETDLLDYLQSQQISELTIVGMMTHMCIDATVRAAKDLEFNCIVIGDACATKDLEINEKSVKAKDVQTAFLAALNFFYAEVKNTKDYLS